MARQVRQRPPPSVPDSDNLILLIIEQRLNTCGDQLACYSDMYPFLSKITGTAYLNCDTTPHPRVRIFVVLAVALAACIGHAQPACPSVSFQGAASASLKPSLSTHMVVLRQSDGSYTAFELTDASPYRIVRTTEDFQRQFAGCPGFPVVGTLPSSQPPEVFTRLESGGYLWVRRSDVNGPPGSYFTLYVAAFDSALHLTSEAQYPVLTVEALAVVDVNGGTEFRTSSAAQPFHTASPCRFSLETAPPAFSRRSFTGSRLL